MKTIRVKGNYRKAYGYLNRLLEIVHKGDLNKYGEEGVRALQNATPSYTGKTADSWSYSIERDKNGVSIVWSNDNNESGVNVAILIQYDHYNVKSGGIIKGIDYINPALQPIFEKFADEIWEEVTST